MQTAASSNLVLTDFSSFSGYGELQKQISHGGFYQQVLPGLVRGVYGKQTLTELGNRLVALIRHAYGVRQIRVVEEASQLLLKLPLGKEYKGVGRYYQALCTYQRGRFPEARVLLEKVAGELPLRFRGNVLLAAATNNYESGDLKSCLLLNVEASRAATSTHLRDPLTFVTSQRNIAVVKSINGDHRGALSDLENLFPLALAVGRWQPYLLYQHLNSLAVELCEVGRIEEARNVSRIVLASPFAAAYPEWRETSDEIELRGWRPSRSTVAVSQIAPVTQEANEIKNLVTLPTAWRDSPAPEPTAESQPPARVIKFPSRTPSMSEQNDKEQLEPIQKRRLVADKLYEMFMASLEDGPIDVELVEKLWNVYLESRKQAK